MSPSTASPKLDQSNYFKECNSSMALGDDSLILEKEILKIQRHDFNLISKETTLSKFEYLKSQWKNDVIFISNENEKCMNPSYQEIIGLGIEIVPILISEIINENSSDWYWALSSITRENPVSENDLGNQKSMSIAWINWWLNEQRDKP